jgi:argininosuccinate lyase
MYEGAKGGFTNATDAADYLVKKGLPFRDAHAVIGNMVFYCIQHNKAIVDLSMEEMKTFSDIIEEDIYDAVSMETCVNDRKVIGGPAKQVTLKAIGKAEKYINSIG